MISFTVFFASDETSAVGLDSDDYSFILFADTVGFEEFSIVDDDILAFVYAAELL